MRFVWSPKAEHRNYTLQIIIIIIVVCDNTEPNSVFLQIDKEYTFKSDNRTTKNQVISIIWTLQWVIHSSLQDSVHFCLCIGCNVEIIDQEVFNNIFRLNMEYKKSGGKVMVGLFYFICNANLFVLGHAHLSASSETPLLN